MNEIQYLFIPLRVTAPVTQVPAPFNFTETEMRRMHQNRVVFHDFIVLLEYISDFVDDAQNKVCRL